VDLENSTEFYYRRRIPTAPNSKIIESSASIEVPDDNAHHLDQGNHRRQTATQLRLRFPYQFLCILSPRHDDAPLSRQCPQCVDNGPANCQITLYQRGSSYKRGALENRDIHTNSNFYLKAA